MDREAKRLRKELRDIKSRLPEGDRKRAPKFLRGIRLPDDTVSNIHLYIGGGGKKKPRLF